MLKLIYIENITLVLFFFFIRVKSYLLNIIYKFKYKFI